MGLDHVRSEIEHMRVQVGRQRKEIIRLQRVGISTAALLVNTCGSRCGIPLKKELLASVVE